MYPKTKNHLIQGYNSKITIHERQIMVENKRKAKKKKQKQKLIASINKLQTKYPGLYDKEINKEISLDKLKNTKQMLEHQITNQKKSKLKNYLKARKEKKETQLEEKEAFEREKELRMLEGGRDPSNTVIVNEGYSKPKERKSFLKQLGDLLFIRPLRFLENLILLIIRWSFKILLFVYISYLLTILYNEYGFSRDGFELFVADWRSHLKIIVDFLEGVLYFLEKVWDKVSVILSEKVNN